MQEELGFRGKIDGNVFGFEGTVRKCLVERATFLRYCLNSGTACRADAIAISD
jgi:hypothetical protein